MIDNLSIEEYLENIVPRNKRKKHKIDERPCIKDLMNEQGFIVCNFCKEQHRYRDGAFSIHLQKIHNINYKEYYEYIFGDQWKNCKCGCGEITSWYQQGGYYVAYISGHNYRGKTKENDPSVVVRIKKMTENENWKNSTFKEGTIPWNEGLTVETSEVLAEMGRKVSKNHPFKGKTKENCPALKIIGEKISIANKKNYELGILVSFFKTASPEQIKSMRLKCLESLLKNGNHGSGKRFKNGLYISTKTGETNRYQSGWELERMKQYDLLEQIEYWKKSKDIIPYISIDGKEKFYNPDFELHIKDGNIIIEEIKGYIDKDIVEKVKAAEAYYSVLNKTYNILTKFGNTFKIVSIEDVKPRMGGK